MSRPRKHSPAADQVALIDAPRPPKRRVELATDRAIRAAGLEATDAAAAALARELARAVDDAARARDGRADPYGIATAGRELREVLARLGLDPASRGGAAVPDALAAALADLARPDTTE